MTVILSNDGMDKGKSLGPYDYAYIANNKIIAKKGNTLTMLAERVDPWPEWSLTRAASELYYGSKYSMVFFINDGIDTDYQDGSKMVEK